MAETTKIEWAQHTWSPWHGCVEVHAGCDNCYARETAKRNPKTLGVWGANGTRVLAAKKGWEAVLRWNAAAACNCNWPKPQHSVNCPQFAPNRPRVFPSICDPFEDFSGAVLNHKGERLSRTEFTGVTFAGQQAGADRFLTLDDLRRDLFALIDATPNLDWLILTKRPENILRMWRQLPSAKPWMIDDPRAASLIFRRSNVWLLTSVSDQATADAAIPELLKCRDLAPVLGVSYEPALGAVDFTGWLGLKDHGTYYSPCQFDLEGPLLDWIIYGGESGRNARPCDVAWARSTRDQCAAAGTAFFLKQAGSVVYDSQASTADWPEPANGYDTVEAFPGKTKPFAMRLKLADKKGGDWTEWPEALRVREFPRPELTHAT